MGRGSDITIRNISRSLKINDLINKDIVVKNIIGANGGIALEELYTNSEDYDLIIYSPSLLLINLTNQTEYNYKNFTPIANFEKNWGGFAVSKESKYKNIKQIMSSLKKDPQSITVAGDSPPGSANHIQFLLAAKAAGVSNLAKIRYVSFKDGQSILNLLGGHVDLVSTKITNLYSFLKNKSVRGLAVTSPARIDDNVFGNIPTLKEEGINSTFIHWKGIIGASNMSKKEVEYWEKVINKLIHTDDWEQISLVKKNNHYMNSKEFNIFLNQTNNKYKIILEEIGMLNKVVK